MSVYIPVIPEHIRRAYGSAREFKQNKRALLAAMRPMVSELRRGCAYMPPEAQDFCDLYGKLTRACSQEGWGR